LVFPVIPALTLPALVAALRVVVAGIRSALGRKFDRIIINGTLSEKE
jgi:small basic protein